MTRVQINTNTNFTDYIDAYSDGEDFVEEIFNRPIIQIGLNTGWLKNRVNELTSGKEDKFIKRTGFNKDFGTTSNTVVEGNDPRLSDARTPLPHDHNLLELKIEGAVGNGFLFYNGANFEVKNTTTAQVSFDNITNMPTYFRASVGTVDGLYEEFQKKANRVHPHAVEDISGLRDELNFLLTMNRSIPKHSHPIEEVDDLQDALDQKSDADHTHEAAEIEGLADFVKQNLPTIKIVREGFTSTGGTNYSLITTGVVFKLTLNGIDLEASGWNQLDNILTVPDTNVGDRLLVYAQESPYPTLVRVMFIAVAGNNVFTLSEGVQVWQVTLNGIDIEEYVQTGTNLDLGSLNAGDIVIAYGNTGG